MNIKNKRMMFIVVLVMFLLAGSVVATMTFRGETKISSNNQKTQASKSMFEFTGASGWRQGPSNGTSMALFSSANPDGTSQCFTSAEYHSQTVDSNTLLQKSQQELGGSGRVVAALEVQPLTIQTDSEEIQYQLNSFKITAPEGSGRIMGGHAIGYAQLTNGYLKIYGNCNSAEELSTLVPALKAYKFVNVK